jgi:uncharacterized protein (TIGR02588 family)
MSKAKRKNWLEWCVFGLGAVVILATTAYLVAQAVKPPERTARVTVTLGAPEPGPAGYFVPVEVRNAGAGAAITLTVEVAVQRGGTAGERAALVIDYLPGYSRRTGRVVFRADPRDGELAVRSLSYAAP